MKLSMDPVNLNYFEALASATRLEILRLLAERDRNIKELAEELDISSSIVTKHVRKLESARLISTRNVSRDGNRNKVCTLLHTVTEIESPQASTGMAAKSRFYNIALPVGLFTDIEAVAPCGIANLSNVIGSIDSPAHLLLPDRAAAQLLWTGGGFIEYLVPNLLKGMHTVTAVELSGEFGQALTGDNSPTSVTVSLSGLQLCTFSVPAMSHKSADIPAWWRGSPYGIFQQIRIDQSGVTVNGEKKSTLPVSELDPNCERWALRFDIESAASGGGLAIFGEQSGNYSQDLLLRVYYE